MSSGDAPAKSKKGTTNTGPEVLSVDQVMALCHNMTNDKARATRAGAVILAESGGKTDARCYNRKNAAGVAYCGAPGPGPGGTGGGVLSIDRGLVQLNSVYHPEFTDAEADDPRKAVSAMWHLSHGFVDFHDWSTYNSGAYLRYLTVTTDSWDAITAKGPGAWTKILAGVGGAFVGAGHAAGKAAGGVVSATMSVGQFLGHLGDPATWKRVVMVIGGLVAVVIGAFLLDRDLLAQVAGAAVTNAAGAAASAAV